MAGDDPDNVNRPAQLKGLADELADVFDGLQKFHSEKAQDAGYARELFRKAGDAYQTLPNSPDLTPAVNTLTNFRDYVVAKEEGILSTPSLAGTSYTIVTSTMAVTGVAVGKLGIPTMPSIPTMGGSGITGPAFHFSFEPPPFEPPGSEQIYAEKFGKLDPELGRVYRSVWEGLRGTASNPERIALQQMRQTFDHLFGVLAPNEDVRRSPFFNPKGGEKPNQVYRSERILYAANTHIADKEKRRLLSSQADVIADTYDELNKLHERGPLDGDAVRKTLTAMDRILREWLDAVVP